MIALNFETTEALLTLGALAMGALALGVAFLVVLWKNDFPMGFLSLPGLMSPCSFVYLFDLGTFIPTVAASLESESHLRLIM